MEIAFIPLSVDVEISIEIEDKLKNWPLWLVLWSRVTYIIVYYIITYQGLGPPSCKNKDNIINICNF